MTKDPVLVISRARPKETFRQIQAMGFPAANPARARPFPLGRARLNPGAALFERFPIVVVGISCPSAAKRIADVSGPRTAPRSVVGLAASE